MDILFVAFSPRENDGGQYPDPETLTDTWSCVSTPHWRMDAFEGIHVVQLSSSPPQVSRSSPGYEVLVTGSSGIAVYSSHTFFGNDDFSDHRRNKHSRGKEERCPVGRGVERLLKVLRPCLGCAFGGHSRGRAEVLRSFWSWSWSGCCCGTAKGIVRVDRPGA
ncbi:hypothetical protein MHYP_G00180960 [Metynnis hypsauchen]